jgi:hypothetical protein
MSRAPMILCRRPARRPVTYTSMPTPALCEMGSTGVDSWQLARCLTVRCQQKPRRYYYRPERAQPHAPLPCVLVVRGVNGPDMMYAGLFAVQCSPNTNPLMHARNSAKPSRPADAINL